ncbi:hypothetical protein [Streptomyces sp. NPDC087212]|uniref:hypothetical protein n=1 Tax=Streptomyces sp. NPDC087212 TaxID=3365766 RepID=UPI00380E0D85
MGVLIHRRVGKYRLSAVRGASVLTVESVTGDRADASKRAQVVRLRREFGFPVPGPGWDDEDDEGLVLLASAGGLPVATMRVTRHRPGTGEHPYMTPELDALLPPVPDGIGLIGRLLVVPTHRILYLPGLVAYAGVTWSAACWPLHYLACVTAPNFPGARRLMDTVLAQADVPLAGHDRPGRFMVTSVGDMQQHLRRCLARRGWRLAPGGTGAAAVAAVAGEEGAGGRTPFDAAPVQVGGASTHVETGGVR